MNKEAILEVAHLIENSKPDSFHMATWFGTKAEANQFDEYEEWNYWLNEDDIIPMHLSSTYWTPENLFSKTEDKLELSCNTTACVAGWAIANEFFKGNHEPLALSQARGMGSAERVGADILGLNSYEEARLFFCDYGSVWYEYAKDYGFEFDPDIPETWKIHPKHAADVLRRIASGDIILDDREDDDEEDE